MKLLHQSWPPWTYHPQLMNLETRLILSLSIITDSFRDHWLHLFDQHYWVDINSRFPFPSECIIRPRSPKAEALIRATGIKLFSTVQGNVQVIRSGNEFDSVRGVQMIVFNVNTSLQLFHMS